MVFAKGNTKTTDHMVSQLFEIVRSILVPRRIRRPEISREKTQYMRKGNFVPDNLMVSLPCSDLGEILMTPRVTRDMVTTGVHTPDQIKIWCDVALAFVIARDEERGLHMVGFQEVEQF